MSTLFHNFAAVLAGDPAIIQGWDFANAEDITEFTATAIASGTAAYVAEAGGILRLSGVATTDNTGYQIQVENPPVRAVANGYATEVARVRISTLDVEWLHGLAGLDTSLIASAPDDGIYLHKVEDVATVNLIVRSGGVERYNKSLGLVAVANVWQTFGVQARFEKDPTKARLQVFLNGNPLFDDPPLVDGIPSNALTPSFAMQSGSATGTQTADVDYLCLSAKRV